MRLTSEILLSAENYLNVYRDREIILRGLKIPAVENLSLLQDQYDVMDFSDNDIKKLDNFPKMTRLITLLFHNNQIAKIAHTLGQYTINLKDLILTNNKIASLVEIKALSSCSKLQTLVLLENPVFYLPNYRYYVIYILPQLKYLDYNKITSKERQEATNLFTSSAGKLFLQQLEQQEQHSHATRTTFVPPPPPVAAPIATTTTTIPPPPPPAATAAATTAAPHGIPPPPTTPAPLQLTIDQRQQIKAAIEKANTKEAIDLIEYQLKTGTFPFVTKPKVNAVEMDID